MSVPHSFKLCSTSLCGSLEGSRNTKMKRGDPCLKDAGSLMGTQVNMGLTAVRAQETAPMCHLPGRVRKSLTYQELHSHSNFLSKEFEALCDMTLACLFCHFSSSAPYSILEEIAFPVYFKNFHPLTVQLQEHQVLESSLLHRQCQLLPAWAVQ